MAVPFLGIAQLIAPLLDKLIPDKEAAAKAKLEVLALEQAHELDEIKVQLSAILAEAQSPDPWTSRARPSMLYVWYAMLLSAIPMGLVAAFSPETATAIAAGFGAWLSAIPETITNAASVVLLGYIGSRGVEKVKGVAK